MLKILLRHSFLLKWKKCAEFWKNVISFCELQFIFLLIKFNSRKRHNENLNWLLTSDDVQFHMHYTYSPFSINIYKSFIYFKITKREKYRIFNRCKWITRDTINFRYLNIWLFAFIYTQLFKLIEKLHTYISE